MRKKLGVLAAMGLAVGNTCAHADITFTGSGGTGLSASVEFQNVGGSLQVTLIDTGSATANPSSLLTAVLFTLDGASALIPSTATSPEVVQYVGGTWKDVTTTSDIGGNWRYQPTLGPGTASSGAAAGISSTGLNLFQAGSGGNFSDSANFKAATTIGSPPWGIATPNFDQSSSSLIHNDPFLIDSAVFTLTGLGSFVPTAANVLNVEFVYGTADGNGDYHFLGTPVPEPTTLLAGALLLLPFCASTMRFLRKEAVE